MSYGLSAYGTGIAPLVALSIVGAQCITTNTVKVTLTEVPQGISALLTGDVYNPTTWRLTEVADPTSPFTILVVNPTSDPKVYELVTLQPLDDWRTQLKVQSSTLKRIDGYPISPPTFATFLGLQAEQEATNLAKQAARKLAPVDLRSPVNAPDGISGTLIIGSSGDYETSMGAAELVKKLVTRRLYAVPGDFWHLPDFGIGLNVKQTVPPSQLVKLKARIREQVLLEPEVAGCSVQLVQYPNGVLQINLQVTLTQTGETVPMSLPNNPNLVQL